MTRPRDSDSSWGGSTRRVAGERVVVESLEPVTEPRAEAPPVKRDPPAPPPLLVKRPRAASPDVAPHLAIDDLELVQIERVAAGTWSYVGTARVHGTFALSRRGGVTISGARSDVLSGELRVGATLIAQNLSGRIDVDRLEVPDDDAPIRSATESFEGAVELASAVGPAATGEVPAGGAVSFRISARVRDGALTAGSTADVHVPRVVPYHGTTIAAGGDVGLVMRDHGANLTGSLHDVTVAATIDGTLHVEMASALPFVQALTGGVGLPGLLAALASSQLLTADGRLRATRDEASLSGIVGNAGLLGVEGDARSRAGVEQATLLVTGGPLAVGVEAANGRTSLVLADARRWFVEARASRPGTTTTTGRGRD